MNHIEIISIAQEDGFWIIYAWLDYKILLYGCVLRPESTAEIIGSLFNAVVFPYSHVAFKTVW
jgi:hypothetical protein